MSKGIKLIELARMSNMSISFLSQIETGKFKGTKETRRKIAKALGVSEELLFGNG
jgi:transcriptional regulator with XRE-family HTH domain